MDYRLEPEETKSLTIEEQWFEKPKQEVISHLRYEILDAAAKGKLSLENEIEAIFDKWNKSDLIEYYLVLMESLS